MAAGVDQTEEDGVEWLRVEGVSDNSKCPCARCHAGTPPWLSGAFPSIHQPGEWQTAPRCHSWKPRPARIAPGGAVCLCLQPGALVQTLLRSSRGSAGKLEECQRHREGGRELCSYWAKPFPLPTPDQWHCRCVEPSLFMVKAWSVLAW